MKLYQFLLSVDIGKVWNKIQPYKKQKTIRKIKLICFTLLIASSKMKFYLAKEIIHETNDRKVGKLIYLSIFLLLFVGWLVDWILWYMSPCRLSNCKYDLYTHSLLITFLNESELICLRTVK